MSTDMARIKARGLTNRIKRMVDDVWLLLEEAYATRAWAELGYDSWDAYCSEEFGTNRIALPKARRAEVVTSMRETGMSTRAIEVATGLGHGTVMRAMQTPTGPNGPVAIDEKTPTGPPVATVTGVNGKTYAASAPAPTSKPATKKKPVNIRAVVADALTDITRARNTLAALTREQITTQDEEARRMWAANLSESIEALAGFTTALTKER